MEKNLSTRVATRPSFRAWLTLATAALALGGCAMIKVGYENADTVGLLWFNRYLDLTSEQKDFAKPRMRQLVNWHRKTQLPDYVTLTQDLKRRAPNDITVADVTQINAQLKKRGETMAQHAIPDLADLALRLAPENIEAMRERFATNDTKFRDEMMRGGVDGQQKARYEKALDRAEEWYGRFSRDQRATIRKLSDARPMNNDMLFAERQRREQEILEILTRVQKEKPSRDAVIALLKTYADRFDLSPDPQRRAFIESLRKSTDEMNAAIHNLATTEQRAKAADKLEDWIETFKSLQGSGA